MVVEDWPTPAQARALPAARCSVSTKGCRSPSAGRMSYAGVAPDRITIFRGPLCGIADDEADLAAPVRVTVLHEVGHYFGMSDDRLHELGWA